MSRFIFFTFFNNYTNAKLVFNKNNNNNLEDNLQSLGERHAQNRGTVAKVFQLS